MSAPESTAVAARGAQLGRCETDILELTFLRDGAATTLPPFGRVTRSADGLCLCVRPARWLVLSAPGGPAPAAAAPAADGTTVLVDLSSALAAFVLAGAGARELLTRGCRLDLDPAVLPTGRAAATIMAQVAVTLAVLPAGVLLLTPSTTAQHFQEWLVTAACAFDLTLLAGVPFKDICGEGSL